MQTGGYGVGADKSKGLSLSGGRGLVARVRKASKRPSLNPERLIGAAGYCGGMARTLFPLPPCWCLSLCLPVTRLQPAFRLSTFSHFTSLTHSPRLASLPRLCLPSRQLNSVSCRRRATLPQQQSSLPVSPSACWLKHILVNVYLAQSLLFHISHLRHPQTSPSCFLDNTTQ